MLVVSGCAAIQWDLHRLEKLDEKNHMKLSKEMQNPAPGEEQTHLLIRAGGQPWKGAWQRRHCGS